MTADFVPPDAFDVHAHLYRREVLPDGLGEAEPGDVGLESYRRSLSRWLGERAPRSGLFFPFPKPKVDFEDANRFLAGELQGQSDSRGLMLIRPEDDPASVESSILETGFAGFKVYHVYASSAAAPRAGALQPGTMQAEIGDFLPEWAWELAERHGLVLMLHIVRQRALADERNQTYLREHCRRYPSAKLILAHAARGFCGRHTVEGIGSLRGLENVWFDTSAVCEPAPLEAVLHTFGPSRLMFGSDFPVSEMRGKCVSVDDGFVWLDPEIVHWERSPYAQPVCVGHESLLAVEQACRTARLTDGDIEGIFRDNARRLLGLEVRYSGSGQDIYRQAKQIIPGATQLLSKRPEMYAPDQWPSYYREARGCEVIDVEGRRFIDLTTSGIGSCLLGYADPDVSDAVCRRVGLGSMCTLNSPEEVELAQLLVAWHPWAEQVRFGRTGGEAMAIAVRIARAASGRPRVAFCGYHGWSDWYLAANLPEPGVQPSSETADRLREHVLPGLDPRGVPDGLAGTALPFAYNQIEALRQHVHRHRGELAAIVMEPTRSVDPQPGFLEEVRQLCDECGAALIFDEISSGWRMHRGGVHLKYGVAPDIAVFGKALGNGHPMTAIVGRSAVMQAAEESFISSTYWTEGVGPTAALATLRKMQRVDVPAHVSRLGELFRENWNELGRRHGVPARASGHAALLHLGFDHPDAAALGTLLTVRMLGQGFLSGSGFYPSLAHQPHHLERYFAAADGVFAELAQALAAGDVQRRIGGPVRHSGFARLT
ncbi:aminotransferase class III-fold pyridoxal phosphate-dependent enzyme [Candidatus Laterigemmans baculatus]|uniref:aminotransferase class III-fold pyridoxal phosphate-dependent enzyme n=1 Tax=Candidatus Laterigemmans baculatus TaxID=2770505 RepID=UPI0013D930BA|nr:aminotransferase class III-fold pyridoxal phosphate-dependent enzyme [Candidatus Laterigemmans baculatus]